MASAPFTSFYPYIRPYVPECPNVVIDEHLAESAARFCAETQCWRVNLEAANTEAGESLYDLDVPAGTDIEAIVSLEVDGSLVTPVLDALEAPSTTLDDRGKPTAYALFNETQVQFYPTPDGAYTFRGLIAVKPKLTATAIDEFIYRNYGRAIAYGAVASLKLVPGKAWSDPAMAAAYEGLFGKGVADAKRRTFRNTSLRVRNRPFA